MGSFFIAQGQNPFLPLRQKEQRDMIFVNMSFKVFLQIVQGRIQNPPLRIKIIFFSYCNKWQFCRRGRFHICPTQTKKKTISQISSQIENTQRDDFRNFHKRKTYRPISQEEQIHIFNRIYIMLINIYFMLVGADSISALA